MSHLAQAPTAKRLPWPLHPWFPDQDDIDLLWHIGLFGGRRARAAQGLADFEGRPTIIWTGCSAWWRPARPWAPSWPYCTASAGKGNNRRFRHLAPLVPTVVVRNLSVSTKSLPGSGKSMRIHRSTQNHRCSDFATSLPWLFRWR